MILNIITQVHRVRCVYCWNSVNVEKKLTMASKWTSKTMTNTLQYIDHLIPCLILPVYHKLLKSTGFALLKYFWGSVNIVLTKKNKLLQYWQRKTALLRLPTESAWYNDRMPDIPYIYHGHLPWGGSVAEWLACWTQAQKGPGSNRSRDAVG